MLKLFFLKGKNFLYITGTTTASCKRNGMGKETSLSMADIRLFKLSMEINKNPEVGRKQNCQPVHHSHLCVTKIYVSDMNEVCSIALIHCDNVSASPP